MPRTVPSSPSPSRAASKPSFSLEALSTAVSTATLAVAGGERHELEQLGYEVLDELGLALSPEDAAVLLGSDLREPSLEQ